LDAEARRYLKRRKLCFACREPWTPGHRSIVDKGHYIEVFSDTDQEDDEEFDFGGGDRGSNREETMTTTTKGRNIFCTS